MSGLTEPVAPLQRPAQAKALLDAQARAAWLIGGVLTAIEGDHGAVEYVLARGALCKRFDRLDDVTQYLDEIAADRTGAAA